MRDRGLLWAGIALVVIGLLGGTLSGPGPFDVPWPMMGPGMHGYGAPDDGPGMITGAETVEVRAGEFEFSPAELAVVVGEPVNIELRNEGNLLHDVTIDELGLRVVAQPGETRVAGFVPDRAGTFTFYCSVPGHAQAGMVGTLWVVEG